MIVASVATGALATIARWLLTRRSVICRRLVGNGTGGSGAAPRNWVSGPGRPSLHFRRAPGCAPCDQYAGVGDVCADLGDVAHIGSTWTPTRRRAAIFGAFTLPTTLIFDVDGATAGPPGSQGRRPLCPETTVGRHYAIG